MSTNQLRTPAQPQRRRGRERVAAIVEAAVELFTEREYSAVTMTEIAERSGTATGSLYRFFPTKKHVADAILERYGAAVEEAFSACAANAREQSIDATSREMVERITALGRYSVAGSALVEALDRAGETPMHAVERIRAAVRDGITRVLYVINADLSEPTIQARSLTVLTVLKGARTHVKRHKDQQDLLKSELGRMLALYLSQSE